MKIRHTKESDILFLQFSEGKVAKTVHREPDFFIDLDKKNTPLSLEIVNLHDTPQRALAQVIREFHLESRMESLLFFSQAVNGYKAAKRLAHAKR